MARRWRLSSKLVFGLVLVLGSLGLLLASSLQSLTTYSHSMKMFQSKLAELQRVNDLYPEVDALLPKEGATASADQTTIFNQIEVVKKLFEQARTVFKDAVSRGREFDNYTNVRLAEDFAKRLVLFRECVSSFYQRGGVNDEVRSLSADSSTRSTFNELRVLVNDMRQQCYVDMVQRIEESRALYTRSLWAIGFASLAAIALVIALVMLCLRWVVKPVQELEQGVKRVTDGDFKHPIVVHSGDELEDLAAAFNNMTHRLDNTYQYLEKQIEDRSRQLVRSERLISVGFLAAGVSHEINNPLASIAFCAESLQSRLTDYTKQYPQDTEVVTKYLKMIQQEAFRCKEITSRLLEFSRVGERRREAADLAELIQNVLEIAQHLQNCRGKRIVFQPYARVIAQVNGQDVKSVVLNLVVNALDSMDEGGILNITLQAEATFAEMTFTDTGCGMKPDVLENIFEPFFTRSKTGKGTGLGLFISHQIVNAHGGEIQATSAGVNQGSTFRVRLPLKAVQTVDSATTNDGGMDADLYMKGTKRNNGSLWMEDGLGNAAA
ncbi:HAMP domain-containing histidine kinase [Telmatocola sphagniphila]|uniref:histidine kinase n=1 Tax=Telmatocola sphagniphila TaxID=1123043 RepID=A0A8E6F0F6_9BACT|nr:HAMP domain-containing sensor histidine kinase [Telmatocola sphagniphila]QVL34481.1 HAMP domain-containing histidine kinase [Telmatocola sphagniphila]